MAYPLSILVFGDGKPVRVARDIGRSVTTVAVCRLVANRVAENFGPSN